MAIKHEEPSIATVLAILLALVFVTMWLEDVTRGGPPAPIEDQTGLCVRPTPQGGC